MNGTEETLADALDAAAETIRPGTLRACRVEGSTRFREKVWNTRMAPAAAAVAVVLAVGSGVPDTGLARTQHHQLPAAVPHAGSGWPRRRCPGTTPRSRAIATTMPATSWSGPSGPAR